MAALQSEKLGLPNIVEHFLCSDVRVLSISGFGDDSDIAEVSIGEADVNAPRERINNN